MLRHGTHAIDVEVQVAALVHAHFEALGAVEGLALRVLGRHVETGHGRQLHRHIDAQSLDTYLEAGAGGKANQAGRHRAYECGGVGQSVVEVAVGDGREGAHERVHRRVAALKRLAVAHRRAAVHVVVGHEVAGVQLLVLVAGEHLYPCHQALVVAIHLVLELAGICSFGKNHLVLHAEVL